MSRLQIANCGDAVDGGITKIHVTRYGWHLQGMLWCSNAGFLDLADLRVIDTILSRPDDASLAVVRPILRADDSLDGWT